MPSLFTSLGLAGSALQAAGAAVRTSGHNISNANTEGYTRQRVQMAARQAEQFGSLQIGTGVEISQVERIMDQRLEDLIRQAFSSLGNLETQDRVLGRVEALLGELDGDSIGAALSRFFDALEELANRPEDHATRTLLVASGDDLASTIHARDQELRELREDLEAEVHTAVDEINRITGEIAALNQEVINAEMGGRNLGTANDLRDRREALVKQLSELLSVRAVETSTGSLNILSGSDFLVFGKDSKELVLDAAVDGDVVVSRIRFSSDGKLLTVNGGKLAGLLECRDQTLVDIRNEINNLTQALITSVNEIHASGVGIERWRSATSTATVQNPTQPLSGADLLPPIRNGSFDLKIYNENTGLVDTYNIRVSPEISLEELATRIQGAVAAEHPQISATVTIQGRLEIRSSDPDLSFYFAGDTSGALAGLGLGTFFTGTGASDIGMNEALVEDPRLIATGQGGGPTDTSNVSALAALRDEKLLEDGGATLEEFYQGLAGVVGVNRARARDLLENQRTVSEHLQNERAAISGVNLDEESIDLMRYQRAYQGAARFLSVIDTLLETLLST